MSDALKQARLQVLGNLAERERARRVEQQEDDSCLDCGESEQVITLRAQLAAAEQRAETERRSIDSLCLQIRAITDVGDLDTIDDHEQALADWADGTEKQIGAFLNRAERAEQRAETYRALVGELVGALDQAIALVNGLEDTFTLGVLEGTAPEDPDEIADPSYPDYVQEEMRQLAAALAKARQEMTNGIR